ncbi:MAG: hypothetical protein J6O17_00185 [Eubacterium sp.]|nr:hypothetical protein [Eubacterium sp.]
MKAGKVLKSTFLKLTVISIIAFALMSGKTAQAAGTIQVESLDEFFDKLSEQIYDRDAYRYYSTSNTDVSSEFVNFKMLDYQMHYREDKPFLSGCYLSYYVKTLHLSISKQGTKVLIELPYTKEEMDAHFAKLDRLAEELKGKDDYETVLNVHDYLIENFEYDSRMEMGNHTDIDGFRDGVMVCSGYALAAYYILNSDGIKTMTIMGSSGDNTSGEIDHMWNMVKLDDRWYNLDITWDDMGGEKKSYDYFLKSDEDFVMHTRAKEYNGDNFRILIADESYKNPESFRKPLIILVIAAAAAFIIIFLRRDNRL